MSNGTRLVLQAVSILILIGLYTLLAQRQHAQNPNDKTIPSWSQLGEGVSDVFEINKRSGERWIVVDSEATAYRFFLGMLVSVLAAFVLGVAMGRFEVAENLLIAPMSLLAKIPPTAALAVFFVMVGTDLEMYVAMIAFGVVPTLGQSIFLSVKDVHEQVIHKAATLGASQGEIIWNIIVRQILPKFIDNVRLQIGPALVYLIAAEMVCASEGFGYRIRIQFKKLDMDVVYPYLIFLALFGFTVDYLLQVAQRKGCPWYQNARGA